VGGSMFFLIFVKHFILNPFTDPPIKTHLPLTDYLSQNAVTTRKTPSLTPLLKPIFILPITCFRMLRQLGKTLHRGVSEGVFLVVTAF
jgi:hypothetical protein